MEDRHIAIEDLNSLLGLEVEDCAVHGSRLNGAIDTDDSLQDYPPQSWFAVLDGHGGVEAAKFAQAQLHKIVAKQPEFRDDPKTALNKGFLKTDELFLAKAERDVSFSCFVVGLNSAVMGIACRPWGVGQRRSLS